MNILLGTVTKFFSILKIIFSTGGGVMSIADELSKVLEQGKNKFDKHPDFIELQKFYNEMADLGLIKKQSYSLSPVDTVGKKLYESYKVKNNLKTDITQS